MSAYAGFYFTADDGYLALTFYSDPEDKETGELVRFVEAGDTLDEVLAEVAKFQKERQE